MTRINLVPPEVLCRQHLVAEYKELPRVFALVRDAQVKGWTPVTHLPRAPVDYVLGPGHLFFFYTRLGFLVDRQCSLVAEMVRRGYVPTHMDIPAWVLKLDREWFGAYIPTENAIRLNKDRINERLLKMGLPDWLLSI